MAMRSEQGDLALPGHQAAHDHGGLPRRDQPDECARLQEGEQADQRVRPGAQRPAGVLDQPLHVGQRDHAEADQQRAERGQPRGGRA